MYNLLVRSTIGEKFNIYIFEVGLNIKKPYTLEFKGYKKLGIVEDRPNNRITANKYIKLFRKSVELNSYLDGLSYFLHQNEILIADDELTVKEYVNCVKSLMDKIGEEL